jgi:hypothetical protein
MGNLNVVRALYHFGRSVSDLARACRSMGEGAYDRLRAPSDPRTREFSPITPDCFLDRPSFLGDPALDALLA